MRDDERRARHDEPERRDDELHVGRDELSA
jgi:hypothetical protein